MVLPDPNRTTLLQPQTPGGEGRSRRRHRSPCPCGAPLLLSSPFPPTTTPITPLPPSMDPPRPRPVALSLIPCPLLLPLRLLLPYSLSLLPSTPTHYCPSPAPPPRSRLLNPNTTSRIFDRPWHYPAGPFHEYDDPNVVVF